MFIYRSIFVIALQRPIDVEALITSYYTDSFRHNKYYLVVLDLSEANEAPKPPDEYQIEP